MPQFFHPDDRSQQAMFYRAHEKIAARDRAFMDLMIGPNPLTKAEIADLIEKDPTRYGRYAAFAR